MMHVDNKDIKYLYIATTKDQYELPIAVADSISELAKMLHMKPTTISIYLSLGRRGFYKITV